MVKYRVSILPGLDPVVYQTSVKGFIEAPNRKEAMTKAVEILDVPESRVCLETKSQVKGVIWDEDWVNFGTLR
jgi:hypothetical protein